MEKTLNHSNNNRVYAPSEDVETSIKEEFYEKLLIALLNIKNNKGT